MRACTLFNPTCRSVQLGPGQSMEHCACTHGTTRDGPCQGLHGSLTRPVARPPLLSAAGLMPVSLASSPHPPCCGLWGCPAKPSAPASRQLRQHPCCAQGFWARFWQLKQFSGQYWSWAGAGSVLHPASERCTSAAPTSAPCQQASLSTPWQGWVLNCLLPACFFPTHWLHADLH